ncbi:hypothetical protein THOG05_570008 [Vibrio rotiferianus]|nr:hypothetical protein THOG05_570008 [Vibrio rotiferianus]
MFSILLLVPITLFIVASVLINFTFLQEIKYYSYPFQIIFLQSLILTDTLPTFFHAQLN